MGYYDVLRQNVILDDERYTLQTKPGMVSWEQVEMATVLLTQCVTIPPGARVLLLEGGTGVLAAWAARREAFVHVYDGSLLAARLARLTVAVNDVTGVVVHDAVVPPAAETGTFDLVLLVIPKGRAYARALLGAACRALKTGGRLYLAGPNNGGAKSVIKDAGEIFGQVNTIRTKGRNRVGLAVKGEESPGADGPLAAGVAYEAAGLSLFGVPGVFSWDALDDGTAMLLDTLSEDFCGGERVLDVGCGTGAIGLAAGRLGASAVDMIDSAWLAVASAQQNITANGLDDVCRAWASDLFADVDETPYDLILANPPFHAGHKVDTGAAEALIAGAYDRLSRQGVLRLVANRFLPYERLMRETFKRAKIVRETTRYFVIQVTR